MKENIRLGDKVKDIVTGFKGVVISRIEYISGCIQFGVSMPAAKDGKIPDALYFDYKRLVIDGKNVLVVKEDTGGPMMESPHGYTH